MEPKQKQYPAVDVTGDRSKIRCCKEQYCIGTWNVRQIGSGQKRDGKGERRHSRNQRTKMDWLLLLLSHFSRVRLCATPETAPPGSPVPGILQARTLEWVSFLTHMTIISTTAGRTHILECEVKWALESITRNKASGGDGIPVELFHELIPVELNPKR